MNLINQHRFLTPKPRVRTIPPQDIPATRLLHLYKCTTTLKSTPPHESWCHAWAPHRVHGATGLILLGLGHHGDTQGSGLLPGTRRSQSLTMEAARSRDRKENTDQCVGGAGRQTDGQRGWAMSRRTREASRLPPAQARAQVTSSDQFPHAPADKVWASNGQPGWWLTQ